MIFAEFVFCISLAVVAYVYIGYLASAVLLAKILNRNVSKQDIEPSVTVVISAFNEEQEIEQTILNKLAQDYQAGRLEVIVVSDGSVDRTDDIVRELVDRSDGRLRFLRQEPRQGKTQALNLAIQNVTTDIVVFADANSIYAPNTIRMLVRNFADPTVGYVTGRMVYTNPADSGVGEGSGTYISYENVLRVIETKLGSIVGVNGGIDAIRKNLYVPMRADQLPDFVLPLSVVENGKRVVFEPEAVVYEQTLANAADEFRMRVRVSLRALWALYDKRRLLNPLHNGLYAWQLISHKVMRYVAFLPLFGLLLSNLFITSVHPFYFGFLILQLVVYTFAVLGHFLRNRTIRMAELLVPYYFFILNAACGLAFWKFINGKKMVLWKPREGA